MPRSSRLAAGFTALALTQLLGCEGPPNAQGAPGAAADCGAQLTPDQAQRVYNTLFPHYAEVCTVTQYVRGDGDHVIAGGRGGHATMIMNGVCVDDTFDYPRLRMCEDDTDLSNADAGTSISVNQVFRNVNWMAFEGRRMFLRGGLGDGEVLTPERFEQLVDDAVASGLFDGIEMTDAYRKAKPPGHSRLRHLVEESIGTDFGVTLARAAACVRVPLPPEALRRVAEDLNARNDHFARGVEDHEWNALHQNCSHAVHNALAATGLTDPKSVNRRWLEFRLANLSIPANSTIRMAEAVHERPIDDYVDAFRHEDLRETFDRDGWISTQPGGLVMLYLQLPSEQNQIFLEGQHPLLFSVPVVWNKEKKKWRFLTQPRYRDLGANLRHFAKRYERILTTAPTVDDFVSSYRRATWTLSLSDERRRELRDFHARFTGYVESQIARTADLQHKYEDAACGMLERADRRLEAR